MAERCRKSNYRSKPKSKESGLGFLHLRTHFACPACIGYVAPECELQANITKLKCNTHTPNMQKKKKRSLAASAAENGSLPCPARPHNFLMREGLEINCPRPLPALDKVKSAAGSFYMELNKIQNRKERGLQESVYLFVVNSDSRRLLFYFASFRDAQNQTLRQMKMRSGSLRPTRAKPQRTTAHGAR